VVESAIAMKRCRACSSDVDTTHSFIRWTRWGISGRVSTMTPHSMAAQIALLSGIPGRHGLPPPTASSPQQVSSRWVPPNSLGFPVMLGVRDVGTLGARARTTASTVRSGTSEYHAMPIRVSSLPLHSGLIVLQSVPIRA
jgi:hypothetical protein